MHRALEQVPADVDKVHVDASGGLAQTGSSCQFRPSDHPSLGCMERSEQRLLTVAERIRGERRVENCCGVHGSTLGRHRFGDVVALLREVYGAVHALSSCGVQTAE